LRNYRPGTRQILFTRNARSRSHQQLDLFESGVTEQRAKSVGAGYISGLAKSVSGSVVDVLRERGPDGFV
jgi:hypothetical protein